MQQHEVRLAGQLQQGNTRMLQPSQQQLRELYASTSSLHHFTLAIAHLVTGWVWLICLSVWVLGDP
jgi:hypothetical protein